MHVPRYRPRMWNDLNGASRHGDGARRRHHAAGTAHRGADAIKFVDETALVGRNENGPATYFNQKSPARADAQAYDEAARRTLRERTLELING